MKTSFPDPTLPGFLIVDDCEDDAFLLRRGLRDAEFTNPIRACETTATALEILRASAIVGELPAFLFVDIRMPGVSGFDLIAEVRAEHRWDRVRIVVVTNSNTPADLQRAVQLGADGYLIKFPPAELLGDFLRHGPWFTAAAPVPTLAHALSA